MNQFFIFAVVAVLSLTGCTIDRKKSAEALNPSTRLPLLHVKPEESIVAAFKKAPDASQPWVSKGRIVPLSINDLGLAGNIRLVSASLYLDGGSHAYILADEKDRLFAFCTSNPSDSNQPAFHLGRLHFTKSGSVQVPAGSPSYKFLYRLIWSFSKDPRYKIDSETLEQARKGLKISEKEIQEMLKEPN